MKKPYINRIVSAISLPLIALSTFTASAQAGVVMSTPDLPPIGNDVYGLPTGYLSPDDVHAMYSGPMLLVVLTQVEHRPFALLERRREPDGTEIETFQSTLDAMASFNGAPPIPIRAEGPVMTRVSYGVGGGPLGTFMTEMLSLDLTGMGFMVRESPTKQSLGQTTIQLHPDGYRIDSFFDVFTDLSLDGGATWMENIGGPTHVELHPLAVPEPGSMGLLILGASGLVLSRLRRRS